MECAAIVDAPHILSELDDNKREQASDLGACRRHAHQAVPLTVAVAVAVAVNDHDNDAAHDQGYFEDTSLASGGTRRGRARPSGLVCRRTSPARRPCFAAMSR
jgi:hypothetical protein